MAVSEQKTERVFLGLRFQTRGMKAPSLVRHNREQESRGASSNWSTKIGWRACENRFRGSIPPGILAQLVWGETQLCTSEPSDDADEAGFTTEELTGIWAAAGRPSPAGQVPWSVSLTKWHLEGANLICPFLPAFLVTAKGLDQCSSPNPV